MAHNYDPKTTPRAVDLISVSDGISGAPLQQILLSLTASIAGHRELLRQWHYSNALYPETLDRPTDEAAYEALFDRLMDDDLSALGAGWNAGGGALGQATTDLQAILALLS